MISQQFLAVGLLERMGESLQVLHTGELHFDASPGESSRMEEQEELTAEGLRILAQRPAELLKRFCKEVGGIQAEQEHLTLFLSLLKEIREGGAVL